MIDKSLLESINAETNAFIHIAKEAKLTSNADGELGGLTVSIKDNICVADMPCTAGSKILSNFVPTRSAWIIDKIKAEGGIIIGKTNLDEFGMGSSGANSAFGPTSYYRHFAIEDGKFIPRSPRVNPGGSSSGGAVSIQTGMVDIAIGSDTGGSVRQPSAFTGIYGFKPTYGLISRNGLISYASSLDQIGILSYRPDYIFRAFETISNIRNIDPDDSTSVHFHDWYHPVKRKMKLAFPKQFNPKYNKGISPEVADAINAKVDSLSSLHEIEEVDLPILEYAIPIYYIIAMAEASSNLSRYDGVRYGVRSDAKELAQMYRETRSLNFGPEVIKRIALGAYVLSAGYQDAYYKKALAMRSLMTKVVNETVFDKGFDLIIGPTTPTTADKASDADSLSMYLGDVFTVPANLMGLPAASIPIQSRGYPVGLQIMGKKFGDKEVLYFMEGR